MPLPDQVTVRVPAKVNLGLLVGPLRGDGYHELSTVFHAVGLFDDVTVSEQDHFSVSVSGPQAALVPTDENNLALRAVRLLAARAGVSGGVQVRLRKDIPVAGGMAGGSADAAGALLAADHLWRTGLSREELHGLAAELGSDVPFALLGGTALGHGRGERLTPVLTRGDFHWVLALPDFGLSTPAVFGELDRARGRSAAPDQDRPQVPEALLRALVAGRPQDLGAALVNDLQAPACALAPGLRAVLETARARGALGAVVSGSGPTVAALAADGGQAADLALALAAVPGVREVRRAWSPAPGARLLERPCELRS